MTTRENQAPLCECGCGQQVEESRKRPGTWNRFYSRHTSAANVERFKSAPLCKCGCGAQVTWSNSSGGRWHAYADHIPLITDVGPCFTRRQLAAVLASDESDTVGSKTGVSMRTLERRVARGDLPQPVRVRVDGKSALHVVFLANQLDKGLLRKLRSADY